MAKNEPVNQNSANTAEIQLALETPERLAWRKALIEGNLQKIKDQWFESYGRMYELIEPSERHSAEHLDRTGNWVLGRFHDDRVFQRSTLHCLEESKQPHALKATLAAEPNYFASPLEVAMRRCDKELFKVVCQALGDGKYFRQYSELPDTWSFGHLMFELHSDDVVGRKFGPLDHLHKIFSSIFILAFLLDDGKAYVSLLRAGLDDVQVIRELSQYLDECKERYPRAIARVNKILKLHGYPVKKLSQWREFCDFRIENQMKFNNAFADYSTPNPDERNVSGSGIQGLFVVAPSVQGSHLVTATEARDLQMVKALFDAGALPNCMRDVGYSWFARLAESMDASMFSLWLDCGANPMLGDTTRDFGGFVSQTALFTLVWQGNTELVKLCLSNARKPMPLTWIEREDGEEPRDVLPFEELADLALQRAQEVPERGPEFERLASLLRQEPARQKSLAGATELDSCIRQAPSGPRRGGPL